MWNTIMWKYIEATFSEVSRALLSWNKKFWGPNMSFLLCSADLLNIPTHPLISLSQVFNPFPLLPSVSTWITDIKPHNALIVSSLINSSSKLHTLPWPERRKWQQCIALKNWNRSESHPWHLASVWFGLRI